MDVPMRPPKRPRRSEGRIRYLDWKTAAVEYACEKYGARYPEIEKHIMYDISDDALEKACSESADPKAVLDELAFFLKPPTSREAESETLLYRERWLKAFDTRYEDSRENLKVFIEFIDTCASRWNPLDYHSPHTSIVQSSGTGKSRLIKEFAKQRYVIYCCLRPRYRFGIPARSWIADKLLMVDGRRLDADLLFASFICACIEHLIDFVDGKNDGVDISPGAWRDQQLVETEQPQICGVRFWEEINSRMSSIDASWKKMGDDRKRVAAQDKIKDVSKRLVESFKFVGLPTEGALVTVAVDEARALFKDLDGTTLFSIYQGMLSYVSPGSGIFTVLLDTSSKIISNFTLDPTSKNLYPPFYMVNTFNTLAPKKNIWNVVDDLESDMTEALRLHFQKGRPLFASYLQIDPKPDISDISDVVRLVVAKLLGGVPVMQHMEIKITAELAVALLSVRAALCVKPQLDLASSLVASHLAMCIAISPDQHSIFSFHPSEPVVAEAACRIMNHSEKLDLSKFFDPILPYLREEIVEGGARGELVARILFLLAWDHACNRAVSNPCFSTLANREVLYTRPLRVGQFLDSLVDNSLLKKALKGQIDMKAEGNFFDGRVFFTHFVAVTYNLNRDDLMHFYEAGAAIMCKRSQQNIGLIIPVWLVEGVMSYILVQVRNCKYSESSDVNYKWVSKDVMPQNVGLEGEEVKVDYPYLALYLQLGYDIPEVYNLKYGKHSVADCDAIPRVKRSSTLSSQDGDPFQMVVGVFSVKEAIYPFLRDGDSKNFQYLSALLLAWQDPLEYVEKRDDKFLDSYKKARCNYVMDTCSPMYKPKSYN